MKKIFIVGLSSFIGSSLARELRQKYLVCGNYFSHPLQLEAITSFPNFLASDKRFEDSLDRFNLEAIIYSAGVIDEQRIRKGDPDILWGNFHLPSRLARFANDKGIPFIFFSSSKVFSGQEGDYKEDDIPHPQGNYGRLKLLAEDDLKRYETTIILRLGTAFGLGLPFQSSALLSRYIPLLREKKTIEAIVDESRTFISAIEIAKAIDLILTKGDLGSRLFHLGNGIKDSYYSFVETIANVFGFEKVGLKPISGAQFRGALASSGGARGTDLSLQGESFSKFYGMPWASLVDSLYEYKVRMKNGEW